MAAKKFLKNFEKNFLKNFQIGRLKIFEKFRKKFLDFLDFLIFTIFSEPLLSSKNVIFRFIKIFENFQNGLGTPIFWFSETSLQVDYKIQKSTN